MLTKQLTSGFLSDHISKQIIRSSTSVTANLKASNIAHSKASYIAKLSISIEELDESKYWLELILENELNQSTQLTELMDEANQLLAILWSSRRTARKRLNE